MILIKYPEHPFRIKEEGDKEFIFDEVRKQWIRLTPEEWVRQNMLQYLIQIKEYPASLIAIEKEIRLGELRRRFDIVIYQSDKPWLMVECKEMNVPLNESVLQQILAYNIAMPTSFLCITNGNETRLWKLLDGNAMEQSSFPEH
jgi:hypothetical protein